MDNAGSGATRSWFDKPEGKLGRVGIIAAVIIIGIVTMKFWVELSTGILLIAQNALYTAVTLGALGLLLALVINPSSRNAFILMYKMFFKMVTGFFITLDPMMILTDYVKQLYANLQIMSDQIGNVKGTMQGLKRKIEEYTKEANHEMEKARVAKEKGNKKIATVSHRKALRRQQSVQKLTALYNKIEMILRVLHKMHENGAIMAEDTKDEVELKEDEWEAIKSANSAMKSAMSVIGGGGDKRANFEQAMEFLIDDVSTKMGEMENFMDMTDTLMQSIDLENDMFDEKMVANLDAWEQKSDSWILGDAKDTIVKDSKDPSKDVEKESFADMKVNIFG